MTGALAAGGAAIAVGDLWLIAIYWTRRAVLAVLGAVGIPPVVFAIASRPAVDPDEARWHCSSSELPCTASLRRSSDCSTKHSTRSPEIDARG